MAISSPGRIDSDPLTNFWLIAKSAFSGRTAKMGCLSNSPRVGQGPARAVRFQQSRATPCNEQRPALSLSPGTPLISNFPGRRDANAAASACSNVNNQVAKPPLYLTADGHYISIGFITADHRYGPLS